MTTSASMTTSSSSEKYFCLVFDHPKIVHKEKMISIDIAYDEVISTSSNGDVTPVQNWRKNAIVPRLDDLLSPVEDAVDGFQDSLLQQFIAKFDTEEDLKPLFKLGKDKSHQFSGNALYDHLALKRAENVAAQVTLRFARWAKSEFSALIAPRHLLPRPAPDPQSSQTESASALTPIPTGTAAIVSPGTPINVEPPGTTGTHGATTTVSTASDGEDEQTTAAASDAATGPPGLISLNEVDTPPRSILRRPAGLSPGESPIPGATLASGSPTVQFVSDNRALYTVPAPVPAPGPIPPGHAQEYGAPRPSPSATTQDVVASRRGSQVLFRSSSWHTVSFEPADTHLVVVEDESLPSWQANRPPHGLVMNHAVHSAAVLSS